MLRKLSICDGRNVNINLQSPEPSLNFCSGRSCGNCKANLRRELSRAEGSAKAPRVASGEMRLGRRLLRPY